MTDVYLRTMVQMADAFRCGLLASDLDLSGGVFPSDVPDQRVLDYAIPRSFSHVPLRSPNHKNSQVSWVADIDLRDGRVTQRRPLSADDLLADSTPIHTDPRGDRCPCPP